MKDQAEGLRKMVGKSKPTSRIIAVTSGKGGVGKTNLAVNLGLALVQMGYRVALIDVDLGLANADILLGLIPDYNLEHVFRGEKELKDILIEGPLGLKLLAGGSGVSDLANLNGWRLEVFVNSLEELNSEFDFVFLDTGAGIHRNVISFVLATSEVLVVTTPEPTSVTDAYGLIKIVYKQNPEAKIRLVVNMAKKPKEAEDVAAKLNSVLRKFVLREVEYLGYILYDAQVRAAVAKQLPVLLASPSALTSRSIKRMAHVLVGTGPDTKPVGIKGFFSRVYDLLSI
ncbi:MAG: MinD/ParA family protein [Firmicutes bacterium]|nr:MinD/ParA family protein [Bacillota bacterium]